MNHNDRQQDSPFTEGNAAKHRKLSSKATCFLNAAFIVANSLKYLLEKSPLPLYTIEQSNPEPQEILDYTVSMFIRFVAILCWYQLFIQCRAVKDTIII